jgi:predicted nuclease of predicted toxin-antitoxin system
VSPSIGVYADVHVPSVLTESLRRRALDVLTSQDDRTAAQDDELLLARASALGRVLFTQDEDFLRIAALWQRQGRAFQGVIFAAAAQQGASLGRLADDLELLLTCCEPEELQDRVTYLPLR